MNHSNHNEVWKDRSSTYSKSLQLVEFLFEIHLAGNQSVISLFLISYTVIDFLLCCFIQGQAVCSYYSMYGLCKYGPSCKFDHPSATYPYNYGFTLPVLNSSFMKYPSNNYTLSSHDTLPQTISKSSEWVQKADPPNNKQQTTDTKVDDGTAEEVSSVSCSLSGGSESLQDQSGWKPWLFCFILTLLFSMLSRNYKFSLLYTSPYAPISPVIMWEWKQVAWRFVYFESSVVGQGKAFFVLNKVQVKLNQPIPPFSAVYPFSVMLIWLEFKFAIWWDFGASNFSFHLLFYLIGLKKILFNVAVTLW